MAYDSIFMNLRKTQVNPAYVEPFWNMSREANIYQRLMNLDHSNPFEPDIKDHLTRLNNSVCLIEHMFGNNRDELKAGLFPVLGRCLDEAVTEANMLWELLGNRPDGQAPDRVTAACDELSDCLTTLRNSVELMAGNAEIQEIYHDSYEKRKNLLDDDWEYIREEFDGGVLFGDEPFESVKAEVYDTVSSFKDDLTFNKRNMFLEPSDELNKRIDDLSQKLKEEKEKNAGVIPNDLQKEKAELQKADKEYQCKQLESALKNINTRIDETDKKIPQHIRDRFAGIVGMKETMDMVDKVEREAREAQRRYDNFKSNMRKNMVDFLEKSGYCYPNDRDIGERLASLIPETLLINSNVDSKEYEKNRQELEKIISEQNPGYNKCNELSHKIMENYAANRESFRAVERDRDKGISLLDSLETVIRRAGLEYCKMLLVEEHKEAYEELKTRKADSIKKLPRKMYFDKLTDLAGELDRTARIAGNTKEYGLFREAINYVLKGGEPEKLKRLSTEYIKIKSSGLGPFTDTGKTRLSLAKRIIQATEQFEQFDKQMEGMKNKPRVNILPELPEAKTNESVNPIIVPYSKPVKYEKPLEEPVKTGDNRKSEEAERMEGAEITEDTGKTESVVNTENQKIDENPPCQESKGINYLGNAYLEEQIEEFYPRYFRQCILDRTNLDENTCNAVVDRMMEIVKSHVTGDWDRDDEKGFEMFEKEFFTSKGNEPAVLEDVRPWRKFVFCLTIHNAIGEANSALNRSLRNPENLNGTANQSKSLADYTAEDLEKKRTGMICQRYDSIADILACDPDIMRKTAHEQYKVEDYIEGFKRLASATNISNDERNFLMFMKEENIKAAILDSKSPDTMEKKFKQFFTERNLKRTNKMKQEFSEYVKDTEKVGRTL